MDNLLKRYYDSYRNNLPPSLRGKVNGKLVDLKTAQLLRKGIKYENKELNAILIGKLDDCLIDREGNYVPVDNKTRGYPPKELLRAYQLQLDIYTLLLQLNGFQTTNQGYVIYYMADKGDPENGIKFEPEIKKLVTSPERAIKVFRDAIKVARRPKAPAYHKECKMCDWLREKENL